MTKGFKKNILILRINRIYRVKYCVLKILCEYLKTPHKCYNTNMKTSQIKPQKNQPKIIKDALHFEHTLFSIMFEHLLNSFDLSIV